ncbi:30S ribosomal protein S17e [Candidatus Woesearchaeota archaeon]|nr:30S ribosomal protein S17e [Candidatus Woesearchaeota archaeon]
MGRIKTQLIKRLTKDIIKMSKPELGQEFEQNKKVVAELISGASKKIRNSVAGYATRLMKVKEEY